MRIASTQYTLSNRSFEIYLSGCSGNPKCIGCYNKELQNFNIGEEYNERYFNKIKEKVLIFSNIIENLMVLGGEPLDQNQKEFLEFSRDLISLNKQMWLFTRYDIKNIPYEIKKICDYIKCGRYIKELSCENNIQYGIKLATSNQKIYKKGIDY
jgi:anaerobic ribonucleoside-triphosphate reductase activating protein